MCVTIRVFIGYVFLLIVIGSCISLLPDKCTVLLETFCFENSSVLHFSYFQFFYLLYAVRFGIQILSKHPMNYFVLTKTWAIYH